VTPSRLLAVVLSLSLAIVAAGCRHGQVIEGPPAEDLDAGEVPLQIVQGPGGGVVVYVEVAFDGAGPYLFALDTGASRSLVDSEVVQEAGLEDTGRSEPVLGVIGQQEAAVHRVTDWRIGDVELPETEVFRLDLRHPPGQDRPSGLLGSDVLSQFQRVVIDYERGVLELDP
jgi:hypothetical protein